MVLVGKTCQCLLYLACHVFLIHLKRFRLLTVFLVLLSTAIIAVVPVIVFVIVFVPVLVLVITLVLLLFRAAIVFVGSSLNIYTLLVYALALFLLAMHLCSLLLTLLPALLL